MKKNFRLLSLLLVLCTIISVLAACQNPTESTTTTTSKPVEELVWVDYVSQVKLDMTSDRLRQEVTVHQFVDGDTTHFNVPKTIAPNGTLKARYLAINTPESTGAIEEWGKAASKFTRSKLESAVSIIIESDTSNWDVDSTGERYLVWIWYKTAEITDWRLLNLEILQAGFSKAKGAGETCYGEVLSKALSQAVKLELNLYKG